MANDLMSAIVVSTVGLLLVAILFPICMDTMLNNTMTGWNSSVVTMFTVLLPILVIIGVALVFVPTDRAKGK